MTIQRKLTCLKIVLSLAPPKNIELPGYQAPIPESEVGPNEGPDDLDQVSN